MAPFENKKIATPSPRDYKPGQTAVDDTNEYEELRPSFPELKWGPIEDVPYSDKGLLGDPNFKHLLADATDIFDYGPRIGTEISGVQLKNLTDDQKNDLARLIAVRGVVFFRDQDLTIEEQLDLGRYYGTLHKHATTSIPKDGQDEVHVVYADSNSKSQAALFQPNYAWHSDVCCNVLYSYYMIQMLITIGHIRTTTSFIHISQVTGRPTKRWRWRHTMVQSICCL